jgi:hypothetical protein
VKVRFRVADDRYKLGEVIDVPERIARCFKDEGRVELVREEPVVKPQDSVPVKAMAAAPVDKMARASHSKARPIAPR